MYSIYLSNSKLISKQELLERLVLCEIVCKDIGEYAFKSYSLVQEPEENNCLKLVWINIALNRNCWLQVIVFVHENRNTSQQKKTYKSKDWVMFEAPSL